MPQLKKTGVHDSHGICPPDGIPSKNHFTTGLSAFWDGVIQRGIREAHSAQLLESVA